MLKSGKYVTDLNLLALDMELAAAFDIKAETGSLPEKTRSTNTIPLLFSANTTRNFYNPKNYESAYDREGNPKVTLDDRFQLTFDSSNIYGGDAYDREGNIIGHGRFYRVEVSGVMPDDYSNFSWYCIIDMDLADKLMRENKNYMWNDGTDYSTIYVKCTEIDNVSAVRDAIEELGFGTYSTEDAVQMAQESTERIQYLLGAIGGVSLLVAAIGIMNTMMMSIYERTREIGIIKVLGCRMGNIAAMFLAEAAFIGLFGGALGLGVSYGISTLLNVVLAASGLTSIIPLYLALGAVLFSIVVAMVSGLYPALRAMRLSPLTAIRNE